MDANKGSLIEGIRIIWTIASKDILESLRNNLILSLILGTGFMLLTPKLLGWMLEAPQTAIIVFDADASSLSEALGESDDYDLTAVYSAMELEDAIGSMGFGLGAEIGLAIPSDFDETLGAGDVPQIDLYIAWANRGKAADYQNEIDAGVADMLGGGVTVEMENQLVFPPPDKTLLLSLATLTSVVVILVMGISLVPSLLFEEKRVKTMEALLVSPASIWQVILGKALAGLFYMLVAAGVMFTINWSGVVHWDVALVFVAGSGLFSVSAGLVLGSLFDRQQEAVGWTMLLMIILIGASFVDLVQLEVPAFLQGIIPWVPSVKLVDLMKYSFLEAAPWNQILVDAGVLLAASFVLLSLVFWKVRRSDR